MGMETAQIFDMIIVGAGLSGIGAACRFKTQFPSDKLAVIEARSAIGGTWDLFRYPGVRSDSDMLTLGYDFRPWEGGKTLADGPSIRNYVRTVADEYKITPYIQFNSKVTKLEFSSTTDLWTLTISDVSTGKARQIQSGFITSAAGYYNYDEGFFPKFDGRDAFEGGILHPQQWPESFDYKGKKIIVIGSGATAVTLVPALAKEAAHVTMLQRSPSYIASIPAQDNFGNFMRRILPKKTAFKINRAKNIWLARTMYKRARNRPDKAREWFRKKTVQALGDDYPVDKHFKPAYNPWDQRVCMIPDEDLFIAIREGRASIETDHIDRITPDGILLKSGNKVTADVIISATGLNVVFNGQAEIVVDGRPIDISESYGYKGIMYSGVPNLVSVFGYTNASWTLRADLISQFVVRVINHMKQSGYTKAMPIAPDNMPRRPFLDFQAGYLHRVFDQLPAQGDRHPWQNLQDYKIDQKLMLRDPIDDGALVFSAIHETKVKLAAE